MTHLASEIKYVRVELGTDSETYMCIAPACKLVDIVMLQLTSYVFECSDGTRE
mgnify:CR=1 FL=1